MTETRSDRLAVRFRSRRWLFEFAPVLWAVFAVSVKTLYVSVSLAWLWWAPAESTWSWLIRYPVAVPAAVASALVPRPVTLLTEDLA